VLEDVRTQQEVQGEQQLQAEEGEGHREEWNRHVEAAQAPSWQMARTEHNNKVQRSKTRRKRLAQAMDARKRQGVPPGYEHLNIGRIKLDSSMTSL
jgi:hypothetical protein